jgi:hypothetical protein
VLNLDILAQKGAIAMKDLDLFQYVDTPQEAFALLKASLTVDLEHEAAFEREHALPGIGVPDVPAPSAQDLLGPDIAKTR